MKYLTLKSDVVIYTDSSKSAGVIDETKDAATGTVVSAKFLKIIEQSLLSDSAEAIASDAEEMLADFAAKSSAFALTDSKAELGKKEESASEEGYAMLNDQNTSEPKGKKIVRKIGNNTLYYYVADLNLKGSITSPANELTAARLTHKGPEIVAEASGCGACGACGACGGCGLCGGANAYVAAAAALAVSAVVALGNSRVYAFDPAKRHEVTKSGHRDYDPEFLAQMEQLNALLK